MMLSMDTGPWAAAVRKHLTEHKHLIPEAASRAAGRLAYLAVQDIRQQMRVTFNQPTRWTLNSVTHVEKSTKSRNLQALVPTDGSAAVVFRESGGKQTSAGRYLYPQVYGGPRGQTRMERRLQMISPGGQRIFLIPTRYAELDAAGNLAPGWVDAVLSAIQALGGAGQGFDGNRRLGKNRKSRASTYRYHNYFVIWPGSAQRRVPSGRLMPNNLPPAIYQRFGDGANSHIRPVFTFARRAPTYRPRLDLHRIVQRTVATHAAQVFLRAMKRELEATPPSGT